MYYREGVIINYRGMNILEKTDIKTAKRGRPKNPKGVRTPAQRQASYREKMLLDGIEVSFFLTHDQADILRKKALAEKKTQSEVIGALLEDSLQD